MAKLSAGGLRNNIALCTICYFRTIVILLQSVMVAVGCAYYIIKALLSAVSTKTIPPKTPEGTFLEEKGK